MADWFEPFYQLLTSELNPAIEVRFFKCRKFVLDEKVDVVRMCNTGSCFCEGRGRKLGVYYGKKVRALII